MNILKHASIGVVTPVVLLLSSAITHASIISTNVDAGMAIRYYDSSNNLVNDAIATDSGTTSASVAINGTFTNASAYSSLGFTALDAESTTFDFDIGYNGGGFGGSGYIGQSSSQSNKASIEYNATSDFDMLVDWNFDYAGSNPFGLQIINLSGGPTEILGNFGQVGHHEGNTTYGLTAGNTYLIEISFSPNASGGIGNIDGSLAGHFDFTFNSASAPEPASLALLSIGIAGLFSRRRKKSKIGL